MSRHENRWQLTLPPPRRVRPTTLSGLPRAQESTGPVPSAQWPLRRRGDLVLTEHSLAETYSVLTRLPGDARLDPDDAVRLIDDNFGPPVLVDRRDVKRLPRLLASAGIAGGAVYDALVALAARSASLPLATRDGRAASTYLSLGVPIEAIAIRT